MRELETSASRMPKIAEQLITSNVLIGTIKML